MSNYNVWDEYYRNYPLEELGWELCKPRPILVTYLQDGLLPQGNALDLCCGAGTNTVYLAQNGYDIAALDISRTALGFAEENARAAHLQIGFLAASFIDLPFGEGMFDFIFDMGCFHHVLIRERNKFIEGVHRVLKSGGAYMLTCFSSRNGPGWNHFTRQQLIDIFNGSFQLGEFHHYSSLEGDRTTRYFYTVLMKKS